jgi:hypothetical protein
VRIIGNTPSQTERLTHERKEVLAFCLRCAGLPQRRGAIYRALPCAGERLSGFVPGRNELRPYINKAVEVVGHDHDNIVENYHAAVLADFSAK